MSWFIFSIIGPFLYSLSNHIDKVLLEKQFKEGGVGTLLLFSSLLSILALPFLFWMDNDVFSVGLFNIVILCIVGILNTLVLWFYLLALKDEEASIVIVFYQLMPIIGLGLGYLILGEVLNQLQLIAMAVIILGTSIISFEIDAENHFKLRTQTIIYMTGASFFWALESVIFKYVALEEDIWVSLFWEHIVLVALGVIIFITMSSYRSHFIHSLKTNSKNIISLNVGNETLYMFGNLASSYAYMLAPIALILLAESFQPIFVFIIGIMLTLFFPNISVEKIHLQHLLQKFIAIIITGIGTYLLLIA